MNVSAVPFGTTGMTITRVGFGAWALAVATVAIAWCLAHPGVTAAIVGARDQRQVDGWIGAPDLELTTADTTEITGAVRRTGAGHGRI
jgi:aryl-alcohol dehydrogenase-like predicted oxidoreductase